MLGIILGVCAILLGIKAFTPEGLPLTKTKKLTGNVARGIGVVCILIGVAFIADGVFATIDIMAMLAPKNRAEVAQQPIPNSPPPPVALPEPPVTWDRHHTADNVCSAEFPSKPEATRTSMAGIMLQRMTLQRQNGLGFYALNVIPRPPEAPDQTPDEIIDAFRDNQAQMQMPDGTSFAVLADESVTQGEVAGRQVDFAAGSEKVSLNRIFVINGSIYRANVAISKSEKDSPDIKRFFESIQFQTAPPADQGDTTTSAPESGNDTVFKSPDGLFEIAFPGTPTIEQLGPNPAIAKIAGAIYLVDGTERAYMVMYSRFSEKRGDPQQELAKGRDTAIASLNAKLLKDEDIEIEGHPGKDITLDLRDGTEQRIRYFATDFELFQMMLTAPKGQSSSAAAEKFISSFRLLKK